MMPAPDMPLLHRDEHLAAFAKPSGLLTHRGWDNDSVVAMTVARDALGQHVYPVHRLDRPTSGVLLFALDPATAAAVQALFDAQAIEKTYVALVRDVAPASGRVDHPIPRREDGPKVPAATSFRLLGASPVERCSLVEAHPETGRLHQVRRHLRHAGHPVIGDVNYGNGALNRHYRAQWSLTRLALHASRIQLPHPVTGVALDLIAELPRDLLEPLAKLGLAELVARDRLRDGRRK